MSIKGFSVGGNVERYDYNSLDNLPSEITIDTALSDSSTNPVQNRVVTSAINSANGSISSISGEVDDLKSDLGLIGYEKHVASNNKIDGSHYIGKTGNYLNNAVILFGCGMTVQDITNIGGNLYVMSKDTDNNTLQGVVFKICDSSGNAVSSDWMSLGTFYSASGLSASELAGRGLLFKAYSAAANYTIASLYVTPGKSTLFPPDAYKEEATITTDRTLSLSDIPADAKAAGDAIDEANTEISSIKSAVNTYVINGLPFNPVAFTNEGHLYNGNNQSVIDAQAKAGYLFEGFERITPGNTANYGVIKAILPEQQPSVLASGQSMELAVYVNLANGTESVDSVRVFVGTAGIWNPNTQSFVTRTGVILKNGWNIVNLPVAGTASADTKYHYIVIATNTLAKAQSIVNAIFFFDVGLTNAINAEAAKNAASAANAENAENAVNAINAGFEQVTANSCMNNPFMTNGGSVSVGSPNAVVCPAVGSYSGQIYAAVSIPIKDYLGKGYKILVTATNQNRSDWYFNEVHISKSPYVWGPQDVLNLSNELSPGFKEKSTIVIDLDSYELDPASYSELYLLYATFRGSGNVAENTLTLDFKVLPAGVSVIATRLFGFEPDDYYTKEEIDALVDSPNVDLLFWGDSLTAGAGGSGTNYPAVCATELGGLTYKNCGVGGETANTIAARQGGSNLIIPAGAVNGTYPYTDFLDVFDGEVRPLRQGNGSGSGNVLYINGQECSLSITQTSSTSSDAVYTISGYTGSASTVPLLAKFKGSSFKGKIVVIWVGTNGVQFKGLTDVAARIAVIDSMIKHIGHDRYVVLGLSTGGDSSRTADDNQMLAHYGNKFFPTRKLLVDYGLTINGLTPTAQDETDIAAGTVPTSLRHDGTHMNAYGYTAIGKFLADKIRSLGYV